MSLDTQESELTEMGGQAEGGRGGYDRRKAAWSIVGGHRSPAWV